jgi:hypothetical protein
MNLSAFRLFATLVPLGMIAAACSTSGSDGSGNSVGGYIACNGCDSERRLKEIQRAEKKLVNRQERRFHCSSSPLCNTYSSSDKGANACADFRERP